MQRENAYLPLIPPVPSMNQPVGSGPSPCLSLAVCFSEIVSAVTLFLTDMIWTVLLRDFKLVLSVPYLYCAVEYSTLLYVQFCTYKLPES
jgi:hypothetical protein